MADGLTLLKHIVDVKGAEVTGYSEKFAKNGKHIIEIQIEPLEHRCPVCGARYSVYDHARNTPKAWQDKDWGTSGVILYYTPARVRCPKHGTRVEDIPWAYPNAHFTKNFDNYVTCLASQASREFTAEVNGIDWETVDRCIHRVLKYGIPETRGARLDNLRHIGGDETSFLRGHKYVTIAMDLDTGVVLWAHEGHGYDVFKLFFEELTPEQRASIETISGDGAKWIDQCQADYVPQAKRCLDTFHAVCWSSEALDKVRLAESRKMAREGNYEEARKVKGSKYALGKTPENLTNNQRERLELIRKNHPSLYRHYLLHRDLIAILTSRDALQAALALDRWFYRAKHFRDKATKELADKIKRHKNNILNTIDTGITNAKVEGTNNKIKLIIRRAYGFRNVKNLLHFILFCCNNYDFSFVYRQNLRSAA